MNKNIIILTHGDSQEAWGSLKRLCEAHNISHNYLKRKKYPFVYRGVRFERVPFRSVNGVNLQKPNK